MQLAEEEAGRRHKTKKNKSKKQASSPSAQLARELSVPGGLRRQLQVIQLNEDQARDIVYGMDELDLVNWLKKACHWEHAPVVGLQPRERAALAPMAVWPPGFFNTSGDREMAFNETEIDREDREMAFNRVARAAADLNLTCTLFADADHDGELRLAVRAMTIENKTD